MDEGKNLALEVLLKVSADKNQMIGQIVEACYLIQEKYQYDQDRTESRKEMERAIEQFLSENEFETKEEK